MDINKLTIGEAKEEEREKCIEEDVIELLEAYVLCPEEELSEDAIERIRKPILKVLKPLLGIEKIIKELDKKIFLRGYSLYNGDEILSFKEFYVKFLKEKK